MAKTLFFTDSRVQAGIAANWNSAKDAVQNVLNLYDATGLPALTNSEFSSLFNNTEVLIYNKMTGGGAAFLTVGEGEDAVSMPVNMSGAIALLEKPTGYSALISGIKELTGVCYTGWDWGHVMHKQTVKAQFDIQKIAQVFKLDEEGVLQYSDYTKDLIAESGKYYIETDPVKRLWKFGKDVVDAYFANGLHEEHNFKLKDIHQLIDMVVLKLDIPGRTFEPERQGLTNIDRDFKNIGYPAT